MASFYDVDYSCFIENKLIEEYSYNIIDKSESKTSKEELRIDIPVENIEKFKQVFLYILKKVGAKPNVGQTVLYKLLYFIDFDYYDLIRDFRHLEETCQATVPQALFCFLISNSFEDCLRTTISIGGDCDTTAAISCAIAEAFYGIPEFIKEEAKNYLEKEMIDILESK